MIDVKTVIAMVSKNIKRSSLSSKRGIDQEKIVFDLQCETYELKIFAMGRIFSQEYFNTIYKYMFQETHRTL